MKSDRVELLTWPTDHNENFDISWPEVHRVVGIDRFKWLLDQDRTKCQIVLERKDSECRLVAEFYDRQTLGIYCQKAP